MERELGETKEMVKHSQNILFDSSGHFILFATLEGVKVINTTTNKVSRLLGGGERSERILALSLFQGTPAKDTQVCKLKKQSEFYDENMVDVTGEGAKFLIQIRGGEQREEGECGGRPYSVCNDVQEEAVRDDHLKTALR